MELLKEIQENGLTIQGDSSCTSSRKTPFYYDKDNKLTRSLVTSILSEYVNSKASVTYPVKCIDVIGSTGISGLSWKKYAKDKVEVKINHTNPEAKDLIQKNGYRNNLEVEISINDPCIVLHERGYNFIYLDCTNKASHYFDAAFRNISRNGVLVVTCKDDCSMHGNTPDVAIRRYGGRVARTFYYQELGIRLVLAAMARTAAKYNKSISVLCCFMHKSSFTIAVMSQKGPALADETLENIRLLKHCMGCEERVFYPIPNGFPINPELIKLDCICIKSTPSFTSLELGPIWAGPIFNVKFLEGMLTQDLVNSDMELKSFLTLVLLEARCSWKESTLEEKRMKKDDDISHPPFYYNIHRHHPKIDQLMKVNKVIDGLKDAGFRASKTHFDKLSIRTDAPLRKFLGIMETLHKGV